MSGGAVASCVGVAALVVFMAQNTADVEVSFLWWDFTVSVWQLTLASALLGGRRLARSRGGAAPPPARGAPDV